MGPKKKKKEIEQKSNPLSPASANALQARLNACRQIAAPPPSQGVNGNVPSGRKGRKRREVVSDDNDHDDDDDQQSASTSGRRGRKRREVVSDSDDDDDDNQQSASTSGRRGRKRREVVSDDNDDSDEPSASTSHRRGRKRREVVSDDDEDEPSSSTSNSKSTLKRPATVRSKPTQVAAPKSSKPPPKVAKPAAPAAGKGNKRKHVLPEKMPAGLVFRDLLKQEWKLGGVIGEGGFGYLYVVTPNGPDTLERLGKSGRQHHEDGFVLKVEPHDNGPLFTELHFYQKAATSELMEEWRRRERGGEAEVGIPRYYGHGKHDYRGRSYRFMVMQRCGRDLQHALTEDAGGRFSLPDVLKLVVSILDCLEYVHSRGYVHADVKAANLLLPATGPQDHIYLVDYGLAARYLVDGAHRTYHADPRRKHDGTPEFTSRDAHDGVWPARRGDLEILTYCVVYWLAGDLPWMRELGDLEEVARMKRHYVENPRDLGLSGVAGVVVGKLMEYVRSLGYEDQPDYDKLRKSCHQTLKAVGGKWGEEFDFTNTISTGSSGKKGQAKKKKK